MKIFQQFNIYFLIMMVIVSVVVGFADAKAFKEAGRKSCSLKARIFGVGMLIATVAVYILGKTL